MRGEVSEVETHKKRPPTPYAQGVGVVASAPLVVALLRPSCALSLGGWRCPMRWVLGALCGSLSGSYAGQFCGGVVSQPQAVSSTPRSLSSSPALEQITTPHALAVPPPESLSRCPSGAIFCLSSGVLHIFQLLTCAPIGGAVGDAWAVLISSTSTPHPIRRTQTKREGAPLARPQPSTPNTKKVRKISAPQQITHIIPTLCP